MNNAIIIQARMGSSRLPKKVMKKIKNNTIIELLLRRLSFVKSAKDIIVAIPKNKDNLKLVNHVNSLGFKTFLGSEKNVLARYYHCAKKYNISNIIRITADCPLSDPKLIDKLIKKFHSLNVDYLSNTMPPSFPDGFDVEIFTFDALEKSFKEAKSVFDKEHVTSFIRNNHCFNKFNLSNHQDLSSIRLTVDEKEDFQVIKKIYNHFYPKINFSFSEIMKLKIQKPNLFAMNKKFTRDGGLKKTKEQKLWEKANNIIPGGNMLLSKNPKLFLPGKWPTYFDKADGCFIWGIDGKKYVDMSVMGVGTNILGYANKEVDQSVKKAIVKSNLSTLNCTEEVLLAEKLIELHPWADMAKFARTGGEANAIAIRIARASAKNEKIAICGYHGWHDWYLSANLQNKKNLNDHLLSGLYTAGVPKNLKGTVFPFQYNNINQLRKIIRDHNVGIIKMEVSRNEEPKDNFLQKVRKIANEKNIILIFDECTSGFRETFGGLHKKYKVNPDMAIFGKALGNGYAITAVIGRDTIMKGALSSFISSTFWTERIGPTAALKTLEVMEKAKSWKVITEKGKIIRSKWSKLANKHDLKINHFGIPALAGFSFDSKNAQIYKTFITQEMLKKGFLALTSVFSCTYHDNEIIEEYFHNLEPVFKIIKECEEGRDVSSILNGEVALSTFQRLN